MLNITVVRSCNFALWVQAWDISFFYFEQFPVKVLFSRLTVNAIRTSHPCSTLLPERRGIMSCRSLSTSTEGSEQNKTVPPFRQRNFHTDNMVGLFFWKTQIGLQYLLGWYLLFIFRTSLLTCFSAFKVFDHFPVTLHILPLTFLSYRWYWCSGSICGCSSSCQLSLKGKAKLNHIY